MALVEPDEMVSLVGARKYYRDFAFRKVTVDGVPTGECHPFVMVGLVGNQNYVWIDNVDHSIDNIGEIKFNFEVMMNVLISLDGAIQGQGLRVNARDWLDMGSETWGTTPDEVKAAAYQAAKVSGWKDEGLLQVMVRCWGPRIDEDQARFTLELLRDLTKQYHFDVEEFKKNNGHDVWKIKGCNKTLPFPEQGFQ